MKKLLTIATFICFGAMTMTSCIVSKKKYDLETARANKERDEKNALTKRLDDQIDQNKRLNALNLDQKSMIASLNGRISRLIDSIAVLEGNVGELKGKLNDLGDENKNTKKQLSSTKEQIADQRKRLEQLQAMLDQQQKAAEALRRKIAEALQGFNSSERTKVYISMQESLLFPSASAVVNPRGKEALSKVAGVLNTSTDININIEGHTDSLPIHTKLYADNWSLSTARATSIAHVLIDEYQVNPAKLVASGRSQYDPIATNSTPDGRAQNRRSEIILEPKLDELMQLMEKK
jgi:chemotaxis protein MotB